MEKKLLMIDDDENILHLVKTALELDGWECESAYTGREGLAQALKVKPSIILLDLRLPDGDGWSWLRKIKAQPQLRNIPVAMVSGVQVRPEDKVNGLILGADDYIAKPFDLRLLVAKLGALIRGTAEEYA